MSGMLLNKEPIWIYEYVEYRYRIVFLRHMLPMKQSAGQLWKLYPMLRQMSLKETWCDLKTTKLTSKQLRQLSF